MVLLLTDKQLSKVLRAAIYYCFVHPVTLQMVFRPLDTSDCKYFADVNWDTVLFKQPNLVVTTNDVGNTDTRGGGCGDLNLPVSDFRWEITRPEGLTLRDVVEGLYRMKGSKYDWWYELMGAPEIRETDDTVFIEVDFDYGS